MKSFKEIVHTAVERDASDLHMTVGLPPIYRIDGDLVNEGEERLTEEEIASAVRQLANDKQLDELKRGEETAFLFESKRPKPKFVPLGRVSRHRENAARTVMGLRNK